MSLFKIKLGLLVIWLLFTAIRPVSKSKIETVFAVRVAYQLNGKILTLQAHLKNNGRYVAHRNLTRKEFIQIASGNWPNVFNQSKTNYFKLNNVEGGIYIDSITQQEVPYCFALDSLWKLRFNQYPFMGKNESGWSNGQFKPSSGQVKYLYDEYGLYNIDSKYFIDTNFWKILRDVRDQTWINSYKQL